MSDRSDKDRERDKHKKHKKHKERDRDREKDRDRDRSPHKNGDREKSKDSVKLKDHKIESYRPKELKTADMFKAILESSDDDEDKNRLKAEKAKEDWKKKTDLSKGKVINPSKPKKEMDDFIEDEIPKKKLQEEPPFRKKSIDNDSPKKSGNSLGFASQGTVKAHDNEGGPECFKCGQVCKDNSNLKNHVLSHYYQVFYEVLPDSKPYPCPICESTSRDRITLVRHYAFTHKKFFEMTDVTPEHLGGARIGSKGVAPPRAKPQKKAV